MQKENILCIFRMKAEPKSPYPMLVAKISVRHKVFLAIASLSLFLGFINYILFQPDIPVLNFLSIKTSGIKIPQTLIQNFFAGHLSDIAWCISLYLCVLVLSEKMYLGFADKIALLFLPFLTEILQGSHLLYGTFDWYDMISYLVVLIIFIHLFPHLIFKSYEKI